MPRIANPNVLVGFETADDAGVYRLTRRPRAGADCRLLHPDCRRPVHLRGDRRGKLAERHLRDGRHAGFGALGRRVPGRWRPRCTGSDSARRLRKNARSRMRRARRPQRCGSRNQVRLRGHRHDSSRPHQAQRRRARGRCPGVHQSDRHRRDRNGAQARHRTGGLGERRGGFDADAESRGLPSHA